MTRQSPPVQELSQPLTRQPDIGTRCPLRLLLERVQDIDAVCEPRNVAHAMFARRTDPDFVHATADCRHCFPVVGHESPLYAVQLVPSFAARGCGKPTDIAAGRTQPEDSFLRRGGNIQNNV